MERLKLFFPIILLAIAGIYSRPSAPTASVYYISNAGSNSNNGTSSSTPWQTLAKLNSITLVPGDQVLLNRGNTWVETLPVNQSGSSSSPITFSAYGTGNNPVVTSLVSLSTWTNQGSNIWVTTFTSGVGETMVLVNGSQAPLGRFPNTGYLPMSVSGGSSNTTFITATGSPSVFTGASVAIRKREWIIDKCPITSISGQTINFSNVTSFPALDTWGFFFTDHEATLDQQNEWVAKSGNLKLYSTSNPASLNVKAATLNTLVSFSSKSYIKFQNINFEGSKGDLITISGGTGNQMLDCTLKFGGKNGLKADFMNDFTMNNCNISYNNYSGIDAILGTNQTFTNNTISYNGMSPSLCGPDNKANHGIWVNGTGDMIRYNTVSYSGYVGIDFSGNNNSVLNNYVHHFAQIVTDGGGIYMSDETSGTGRVIKDNIVMYGLGPRDGTPFPGNDNAMGIYLDESTAGVNVQNNFLAFNSGGGMYLHKAHDISITGNTFYGNTLRQFYAAEDNIDDTRITNITFTGNYLHSLQSTDLTYSLTGTPSINNFFSSINNNVLSKPSSTSNIVREFRIVWRGTYDSDGNKEYDYFTDNRTLAQWKSAHSTFDINSTGTPGDFATGSPLVQFNSTASPITVTLDGVYKSLKNVSYNAGSVTLPPYSSEVLIRTDDLAPVNNIVNFKGRIVITTSP